MLARALKELAIVFTIELNFLVANCLANPFISATFGNLTVTCFKSNIYVRAWPLITKPHTIGGVLFSVRRRCLVTVYDDAADSNSPFKRKYCVIADSKR